MPTIGTVYGDNSTGYNLNGLKTTTSTYAAKSNFDLTNLNVDGSLSSNSIPVNSVETGRVERGEESKQKFTEVDMEFENNFISSTIIQILPESRKPAEIKQIKTKQSQLLSSDEVIELIKKLGELHSAGILTDEEFSSKKAELLSKI